MSKYGQIVKAEICAEHYEMKEVDGILMDIIPNVNRYATNYFYAIVQLDTGYICAVPIEQVKVIK